MVVVTVGPWGLRVVVIGAAVELEVQSSHGSSAVLVLLVLTGSTGLLVVGQCLAVVLIGETEEEVQSSQWLPVLEVDAGPTTGEVVVLEVVSPPGPWGWLKELVVLVVCSTGPWLNVLVVLVV